MPRLPGIGLGLAGLAVFALALLALVQGESAVPTQLGESVPETTVADGDGTGDGGQDTQEDPDSIVRVHPDKVLIQGEKSGILDVTFNRVPLTVWLNDLIPDEQTGGGQDGKPQENPGLSWSPVSAGDGSVPLMVDEIANPDESPTRPCSGNRSIPEVRAPFCYQVGLPGSSQLPAGTYGATIYVGDAPDDRRAIPVEVLVGRPLYWLILVVAAGVLATELVIWWRDGAVYRRRWRALRVKWVDWLSEKLDWTRPYEKGPDRNDVERAVLRVVKGSLHEKARELRTWLERGSKGESTIAQLPATLDAARDMVYPLRLECERYVANNAARWGELLEGLESHLRELGKEAVTQAAVDLKEAYESLSKVQGDSKSKTLVSDYEALENWWKTDPKSPDKKLSEAWVAIKALWRRTEELRNESSKLPQLPTGVTVPSEVAGAVEPLSGYASKWKADVFSKASESRETVKDIDAKVPGQPQTFAFLTGVVNLMPALEQVEQKLEKANHPLKFAQPASKVGKELEKIKQELQKIDDQIDSTFSKDLTKDAVRATILKPVRDHLESTEAKFNDSSQDIKQRWSLVRSNYNQDRHFVRVGEGICEQKERLKRYRERLEETKDNKVNLEESKKHPEYLDDAEIGLKRAYRYLLDGKALDAEIELERAKEDLDNAYAAYLVRANFINWGQRAGTGAKMFGRYARTLWRALKRLVFSPVLPVVIATVVVLGLVLWFLSLFVLPDVKDASQTIPRSAPLSEPRSVALQAASFALQHPWWSGLILGILILVVAQYLRQRWENFWPSMVRLLLGIVSGLLSLTIAVTVILAYQQTVPEAQLATWGTNLDLVVAFALGVLAQRIVRSLTSAGESLMSFLKGEDKPATPAATESEAKDSAATTPAAKPAPGAS
jgi:hypothetical protein